MKAKRRKNKRNRKQINNLKNYLEWANNAEGYITDILDNIGEVDI